MPIDYQQIFVRIKEIGAGARERRKTLDERRTKARDLLAAYASELDVLRSKVDSAKLADSNTRCAYPLNESLASSYPPPDSASNITLIAADGSQINPDRHAAILYCVLNIGTIILKTSSGDAPSVKSYSQLLLEEKELFENGELLSESTVALRRDLEERSKLLELAKGCADTVVTLTDGPLGLWESKDHQASLEYDNKLKDYLKILKELKKRDVVIAGYVDKPGENLVIKLLEIAGLIVGKESDFGKALKDLHRNPPLQGVTDRWLYKQVLNYGERSAVFLIQSKSMDIYEKELSINFFYLNIGSRNGPVRVEIPDWVASDKSKINLLHTALLSQCKIMGDRPYPYILHRAHEVALITNDERSQIEKMLALYGNVEQEYLSEKQSAKNHTRNKRSFHL